jgi:hypothetical protein
VQHTFQLARALTGSVISELSAGRVSPAIFVQIDFSGGTSRIWSGNFPISWNAQTWLGVGKFGSMTPNTEDVELAAQGITLSLAGIPSDLLGQALTECRQGKAVKVWLGFLDSAGAVIADPFQSFAGRMDVPNIDEGAETSTVSITVENSLIDLQRNKERRYTHDDQQLDFGQPLAISTISRTSNVVTAVFASPHGYDLTGQSIVIAGVANATFNGTFTITGFPLTTTVTWAQTASNASSSGGTATVADEGFEYVPAVQDWNGIWGKGSGVPRSAGGAGGQGGSGTGGGGGTRAPVLE